MREFAPSLLEPFALHAKRVTRAYGAFICETDQGCVLIKRTMASVGELWFAHGVKEHLAQGGFENTDRYRLTAEGLPYAQTGQDCYTVRSWGCGEEPELTSREQIQAIAVQLGRMGRYSEGCLVPEESRSIRRYRESQEQLPKQRQRLERYARELRRHGRYTEFDLTLLACLPQHLEQAKEAERLSAAPDFAAEAERAEQALAVAHSRFSNHSVLWEQGACGRRIRITEFEHACYGLPALDLASLLEKTLRKNGWDESLGMQLLEAYDQACPLSPVQQRMIYARLLFPGRLLELCHEVYHVRRRWTPLSYGQKLSEIQAQQEERERFLEAFRRHCL